MTPDPRDGVARLENANGSDPWAILSDEPTDLQTFEEYTCAARTVRCGLRFDIEELFLDEKSAGFQLEDSRLRTIPALERLQLILATATIYLVSTGTAIVEMGRRRWVDPHWQRGLSYFQIGWRWVRLALDHGLKLLDFPWLADCPDPSPAISSEVQFLQRAPPVLALSCF